VNKFLQLEKTAKAGTHLNHLFGVRSNLLGLVTHAALLGMPYVFAGRDVHNLVECSIAHVAQVDNHTKNLQHKSLLGKICEPLVVQTVLELVGNTQLPQYFTSAMQGAAFSTSACGSLWEVTFPLRFHALAVEGSLLKVLGFKPKGTWKALKIPGSTSVCRKASSLYSLADFLENPTVPCFLPEESAGPDLVVALEQDDTANKGFAFFQFKLRDTVDKVKALRTTEWKHFYHNRKTDAVLSGYKDRAQRVCVAMPKQTTFSVVVSFPYETDNPPKQANFRWCGEPQLRHIFGDAVVDFLANLKAAQRVLNFEDSEEKSWA
jgi:hypothetical protein